MRRKIFACLLSSFLFAGCGATAPDPFAGYYLGSDKAVRIKTAGADAYQVRILAKSGPDIVFPANLNEGKLTSEYGGGFSITAESAEAYSMGVPTALESIHKTDSAAFAQWFKSIHGDTAEVEPAAPPQEEEESPDKPAHSGSRFRH